MGLRVVALVLVTGLALGCPGYEEQALVSEELGPVDDFGALVQPVLRDGCSSLDCHGVAERPLRLYARYGLRLSAELRGEDETTGELEANIVALATVDPGTSPEDNLVLLKPLARADGGMRHEGGDLWPGQQTPAYICLHAWMTGTLTEDAAAAEACTDAVTSE